MFLLRNASRRLRYLETYGQSSRSGSESQRRTGTSTSRGSLPKRSISGNQAGPEHFASCSRASRSFRTHPALCGFGFAHFCTAFVPIAGRLAQHAPTPCSLSAMSSSIQTREAALWPPKAGKPTGTASHRVWLFESRRLAPEQVAAAVQAKVWNPARRTSAVTFKTFAMQLSQMRFLALDDGRIKN